MGFLSPTPVQTLAIPQILARRDVLVRSQTGSGKTLAFGLPIVHMLQAQGRVSRTDGISALVLSPTRELCFQIKQVLERAARPFFWVVIGSLVGGREAQERQGAPGWLGRWLAGRLAGLLPIAVWQRVAASVRRVRQWQRLVAGAAAPGGHAGWGSAERRARVGA
jgi:hypothetical protein